MCINQIGTLKITFIHNKAAKMQASHVKNQIPWLRKYTHKKQLSAIFDNRYYDIPKDAENIIATIMKAVSAK
jgi:hypothetical protein